MPIDFDRESAVFMHENRDTSDTGVPTAIVNQPPVLKFGSIQMPLNMGSGLRPTVSFLVVAIVYWLSLWRIVKGNRGNRVIECGSITLMLFFLMMLLMKLTNLPDWLLPSLGLLLFLLCLLTMFFLFLQGVQAIRHHKSKAAAPSNSVSDYAMPELDYEPRNSRENTVTRLSSLVAAKLRRGLP